MVILFWLLSVYAYFSRYVEDTYRLSEGVIFKKTLIMRGHSILLRKTLA